MHLRGMDQQRHFAAWNSKEAPDPRMNGLTRKSCSICGESFGCGATSTAESCWCEGFPRVEIVDGLDCCCPKCLARIVDEQKQASADSGNSLRQLIEGVDYYLEGTAVVFTALYHLRRGFCCNNGCRHCPYEKISDTVQSGA